MLNNIRKRAIEAVAAGGFIDDDMLYSLIFDKNDEFDAELTRLARADTDKYFKRRIYFRGLIELSNYCRKNCYYCGLRRSNSSINRYRLQPDEIRYIVKQAYAGGFRTFVLQGGEDAYYTDEILTEIIGSIKREAPDAAITLSLGERSFESYRRLKAAGADRYLLRHEAASERLYTLLHPRDAYHRLSDRMEALRQLKELGYQTGAGFMVGAPYQTQADIVEDIRFLLKLKPHMVGIGPFVSNKDTPFKDFPNGSVELTLRLLSIIRLLLPGVLLPATTALETLCENGRILGFRHGANVIMPNLTPDSFRKEYQLYDNKSGIIGNDEEMRALELKLKENGFELFSDRGDYK